ncbi:D-alanyl-D-alanine carboxypeptidase [bacterium]|nr:D-alanyl-D-alanine carboxypeptidase [bacterium]
MLEMKGTLRLLLLLALAMPASAAAQQEDSCKEGLTCQAYLLYDRDANQVVALCHPERKAPVASLTKLMTAILAAERLRFDGRYILTEEERETFDTGTMRAQKMLELMLIPSNNSICRVVARIISGSESAFAAEMNARASQLGMDDTRFANSTGLPGEGQHSTLYDLLILARVALAYPRIRLILSGREVELNGESYAATLKELYELHPGLIGGKTGYTRAAGRCLILRYQAGGREFILITMGSEGAKEGFRDAELILKRNGLFTGEVGLWE